MNAAAGIVEVRVPDMGNFKDVAIIDVLVKPGEKIEPEASLVTLETEKATMDVPSTVGGIVDKVHVSKGGTVSPGDLVVTVRVEGATYAASTSAGAGSGANAAASGSSGGPSSPGSKAASGGVAGGSAANGGGGAGRAGGAGGSAAAGGGRTDGGAAGSAGGGSAAAGSGRPGGGAGGSEAPGGSAGGGSAGVRGSGSSSAAGGGAGSSGAGFAAADTANSASPSSTGSKGSAQSKSGAEAAGNGAAPAAIAGGNGLPPINEPGFSRAHAGPSVRKFARELGVDLTLIKGGGFKGRITHEDVKSFVKTSLAKGATSAKGVSAPGGGGALPAIPVVDFTQFGEVETKPLTRIQKISGPRLHASWVNIPHVTQFDDADITDLEEVRGKLKQKAQEAGIKLTPLAFIIRACVRALQEFPLFNSSLDSTGTALVLKKYINIGFAADTPNGLVVPVVKDANRKDVYETARFLGELSEKARSGKLPATDMQGGTFTISSLGGIGGTAFTPIINAPEVAILGVSRSAMKPVFRDGAFVPRLILPLSLSYDHRVIDGAAAARFITFLSQTLADPRSLTEAVP
ncbi:MAG: 2-oxo acid dehydrogenase subunit E2 [Proteobacteria bacterium]|nr:2-oxo acid dehydrogenase subunit E2 [Pseudomonadota bacterium]